LTVEEKSFTVAHAFAAREALPSSAGSFAMPMKRIDGHSIGGGLPGPVTIAFAKPI
jgi:D-alanine transaminase